MIDVSWLGKTNDWVNEYICLAGTSSSDSELSVGSVHWVSGLEGDNPGPAEFLEVKSHLSRSVYDLSQQSNYRFIRTTYI